MTHSQTQATLWVILVCSLGVIQFSRQTHANPVTTRFQLETPSTGSGDVPLGQPEISAFSEEESERTTSDKIDGAEGANETAAAAAAANEITTSTTSDLLLNDPNNYNGTEYVVPPYMQHMTTVLVSLHFSVFVSGLIGNALVCLSVYRNKSLQTVTNYYIVNLAVADFLVILICLPPTVYWDLYLTWNFGLVLCKGVLYLQSISVSVSVLTLTCISIDRWYAICRPLEFSSTKYRAKVTIALIWLLSMLIASPDVIFLTTRRLYEENDFVYTDCTYNWPEENTKMYQLCILTLLFVFPFVLMSISYSHIVNVLWRNEALAESLQESYQLEEEQQQYQASKLKQQQQQQQMEREGQLKSQSNNIGIADLVTSGAKKGGGKLVAQLSLNVAATTTTLASETATTAATTTTTTTTMSTAPNASFKTKRRRLKFGGKKCVSLDAKCPIGFCQKPTGGCAKATAIECQSKLRPIEELQSVQAASQTAQRIASEILATNANASGGANCSSAKIDRDVDLGGRDVRLEANRKCEEPKTSSGNINIVAGQRVNGGANCDDKIEPIDCCFQLTGFDGDANEKQRRQHRERRDVNKDDREDVPEAAAGGGAASRRKWPARDRESAAKMKGLAGAADVMEKKMSRTATMVAPTELGIRGPEMGRPAEVSGFVRSNGSAVGSELAEGRGGRVETDGQTCEPEVGHDSGRCGVGRRRVPLAGLRKCNCLSAGCCCCCAILVSCRRTDLAADHRETDRRAGRKMDAKPQGRERSSNCGGGGAGELGAQNFALGSGDSLNSPVGCCCRCLCPSRLGSAGRKGQPKARSSINGNSPPAAGQSAADKANNDNDDFDFGNNNNNNNNNNNGKYKPSESKHRKSPCGFDYPRPSKTRLGANSANSGSSTTKTTSTRATSSSSMLTASSSSGYATGAAHCGGNVSGGGGGRREPISLKYSRNGSMICADQPRSAGDQVAPPGGDNTTRVSRSRRLRSRFRLSLVAVGSRFSGPDTPIPSTDNTSTTTAAAATAAGSRRYVPTHARFCKLVESRRKAAKMLIVIVIMFGLCYLPIHFLNLLRVTIGLPQNDATTIASLVSHWLCYFNSAVNPLIYNLMSGKFRHEFANVFFCRWLRRSAH